MALFHSFLWLSNIPFLKEISPEYSMKGLMLQLKLQYFGHLTHWKRPWCWERLRAGGKGDNRGWDGWMVSPTQWTWVGWILTVGDGQGGLVCLWFMGSQSRTWLTELNWITILSIHFILLSSTPFLLVITTLFSVSMCLFLSDFGYSFTSFLFICLYSA